MVVCRSLLIVTLIGKVFAKNNTCGYGLPVIQAINITLICIEPFGFRLSRHNFLLSC